LIYLKDREEERKDQAVKKLEELDYAQLVLFAESWSAVKTKCAVWLQAAW